MQSRDRNCRDIIVIGGSAGSLAPLQLILSDLPPDLKAAVFVVVHVGTTSHLTEILARSTALPVTTAMSGEPIQFGRIYVASPGRHLLIHDSHTLLRRGPRENLARPAIDALFRSAAGSFGSRVIGVVLSGSLNDGASGLRAIKRCGGKAIVQDPSDAAYFEMPRNALRYTAVDHSVAAPSIAALLATLSSQVAGPSPQVPLDVKFEAMIAAQELAGMRVEDSLGQVSRFTCPECHGVMWEIEDGPILRYRCHVGHAYTAETMLAAQGTNGEELLWSLMRAHQERAELVRRMARQARQLGHPKQAADLERRAIDYEEDATVMKNLLTNYHAGGPESGLPGDDEG
jgi:two-component system, chemotaxis family, protein-glutamate methylesterase/glutaminase